MDCFRPLCQIPCDHRAEKGPAGVRVGMMVDEGLGLPVLELGVLLARMVIVPLDPNDAVPRLALLLEPILGSPCRPIWASLLKPPLAYGLSTMSKANSIENKSGAVK
eukprot:scaffold118278_cov18-Prasinocladus_malaysianus.AAC.1